MDKELEETLENPEPDIAAPLRLEIDNLKQALQSGAAKITGLEKALAEKADKIAGLEQELAEKEAAAAAAKEAQASVIQERNALNASLTAAVAAYLGLVKQANPGPAGEMVKGETIAAIDASLAAARELVEKVKHELGAEGQRVRVPAGAPPRALPDFSALTARDKIRYGMETG